MPPPLFMLAVYGRPGDVQATLSAYDLTVESKAFVQEINGDCVALLLNTGRAEVHGLQARRPPLTGHAEQSRESQRRGGWASAATNARRFCDGICIPTLASISVHSTSTC